MRRDIRQLLHFFTLVVALLCTFLNPCVFAALEGSKAFELFKQQRYEEAKTAFESEIEITWKDPYAACCYGLALAKLGKTSDAVKVWEKLLRRFPHSEVAEVARSSILKFTGKSALASDGDVGILGLKIKARSGQPAQVLTVFPDTPAASSRIREQDIILKIDGMPTNWYTEDEIVQLLKGLPNTRVALIILRDSATFKRVLTRMHSKAFAQSHPDIWKRYLAP